MKICSFFHIVLAASSAASVRSFFLTRASQWFPLSMSSPETTPFRSGVLFGSPSDSTDSDSIETLPKGNLIDSKGNKLKDTEVDTLVQGKRVALYFGAGWCPMCRELEFMLPQYMNALEDSEQPIQLIYVSSDRSPEMQLDRMEKLDMKMGISVEDELSDKLKLKHRVWSGMEGQTNSAFTDKERRGGIPAFVVLNATNGEELMYLDTESKSVSGLSDWPLDEPTGVF